MDDLSQSADTFTVDHTDLPDPSLLAGIQVVLQDVLDVGGTKLVQVEDPIDRILDCFLDQDSISSPA
jgi:hypothetical protein